MGWAKNRDCEKCHEWVGQCGCQEESWDIGLPPEAEEMQEMLEECSNYFASLPAGDIDQIPF